MKNLSECERCGGYHDTLYTVQGERLRTLSKSETEEYETKFKSKLSELRHSWITEADYSIMEIEQACIVHPLGRKLAGMYSYSSVFCRCASMGAHNCPVHAVTAIEAIPNITVATHVHPRAQPIDDAKPRIGPDDSAHRSVHETIGHILGGKVSAPARAAVRRALDTVEALLTGRANSDTAVGRALRLT